MRRSDGLEHGDLGQVRLDGRQHCVAQGEDGDHGQHDRHHQGHSHDEHGVQGVHELNHRGADVDAVAGQARFLIAVDDGSGAGGAGQGELDEVLGLADLLLQGGEVLR